MDRSVQHGAWGAKLCCWLLLTLGAFFLPEGLVAAYGWLARSTTRSWTPRARRPTAAGGAARGICGACWV